jgi:hypothetical protein
VRELLLLEPLAQVADALGGALLGLRERLVESGL